MRCYVCGKMIGSDEHLRVQKKLDELSKQDPDLLDQVLGALGLVHCVGEPDQFDENGFTVTCLECYEGALDCTDITVKGDE